MNMFREFFSNTIYLKVHPNKFELKNITTGKFTSVMATEPFTTKRLLVGHFSNADKTLKEGIVKISKKKTFNPRPIVIIHPMNMVEGGLSQIEERVLLELAHGAGARKVKLWVGHELTDQEVVDYAKSV